ncbi:lysophospholipid acyltransferase family protein [Haloferula rosea]|uniref:1-acyl-sn-glycerol-3-phosphate acyltransferase n=1 Tax=Haloferula rosea TaxID=490093 RepID=A0A934R8Q0_9BACT|nr:lysophospholipid acyltransferase family protein [Haloferula rosea]MBK1825970.1 1-acyl-sn-glycerol-3-phosphate acyltransferase [Haloferula rosea]
MRWIYWVGWLLFRSAFRSLFGLRIRGAEHLLTEGPVLVVSNHESFLDPPLIGTLYADEMHFLARKSLFKGPAKWVYRQWNSVPVDQEKPDMSSLKTIIRLLKQGQRVLVFPEGARTQDGSLGEAQPGVGLIAVKAGVPIQPIRIRGAREALPRGEARLKFARIEVHIGEPIVLTKEDLREAKGKAGYKQVADRLMAAIADL